MSIVTNGDPAASVTVVIPAKDEAPTIGSIVRRSLAYAGAVIVVDGRSRDGTAREAQAAGACVIQDSGRGKGDGLRAAIPHIRSPITVFIDADGSHVPEDIPRLIEPILDGRAEHVSASRLIGGSSEMHGGLDEFLRLSGSSFITACINWRFGVRLSDSQNGFRAIKTETLRQLGLRANTTTVEQEMIMRTLRRGWRIAEIGSHEHPRQHGASHIRLWRAAPRYACSLVRHLLF